MKTYRSKLSGFILAAAFSIGLCFGTTASGQQTSSYIVDIKTNQLTAIRGMDFQNIYARAINDAGQVAGDSEYVFPEGYAFPYAFITGPNGKDIRRLNGDINDPSEGRDFFARGINDAGQVVGVIPYAPDFVVGFVTGPQGQDLRSLENLGGRDFTYATDINNLGRVVGASGPPGPVVTDHSPPGEHAFITDNHGNNMTDLGTLSHEPFSSSSATGINDAGQVVGHSNFTGGADDEYHAFITSPNGTDMRDLGTLGGPGSSSFATGINDAGQVVGYFETAGGDSHAFITGPNGEGMTDLGTLGGAGSSIFATSINNAGQVVGYFDVPGGTHAFVTSPNGQEMADLNSLVNLPDGGFLKEAIAINNLGQVVAVAAVPEPASYALMLAGLALVGFMVCRQSQPNFLLASSGHSPRQGAKVEHIAVA